MDSLHPDIADLAGQESENAGSEGAGSASGGGGNHCGHDPAAPRYFLPPENKEKSPTYPSQAGRENPHIFHRPTENHSMP